MQYLSEHGVCAVETVNELAREGRSYAAVRLAECEDGRFRFALDFHADTMGFGADQRQ